MSFLFPKNTLQSPVKYSFSQSGRKKRGGRTLKLQTSMRSNHRNMPVTVQLVKTGTAPHTADPSHR